MIRSLSGFPPEWTRIAEALTRVHLVGDNAGFEREWFMPVEQAKQQDQENEQEDEQQDDQEDEQQETQSKNRQPRDQNESDSQEDEQENSRNGKRGEEVSQAEGRREPEKTEERREPQARQQGEEPEANHHKGQGEESGPGAVLIQQQDQGPKGLAKSVAGLGQVLVGLGAVVQGLGEALGGQSQEQLIQAFIPVAGELSKQPEQTLQKPLSQALAPGKKGGQGQMKQLVEPLGKLIGPALQPLKATLQKQLEEALGAVRQTLQEQVQQALEAGASSGKQGGEAKQSAASKQAE